MWPLKKHLARTALALLFGTAFSVACAGEDGNAEGRVRLNELQMIGTHNSYHLQPPDALIEALAGFDADFVKTIQYNHAPLAEQLDAGVRQLELDVYADPEGGRFANRAAMSFLGQPMMEGVQELRVPGFKVMHLPDIDFASTCWTLNACLGQISAWSEGHPGHLPIVIWVEPKDELVPDPLGLGFATPVKVGRSELEALEAEVLAVFGRDRLITPDDVRGSRATLEESVLKTGWPALDKSRGKAMFVLLDEGEKRRTYLGAEPSLKGRVFFTTSSPGQPDAAVINIDNPLEGGERIAELVRAGYLVRTRADADTVEARLHDGSRREKALSSGAQFVGTDYLEENRAFGGGYLVAFEGSTRVRCNPIAASTACTAVLAKASLR